MNAVLAVKVTESTYSPWTVDILYPFSAVQSDFKSIGAGKQESQSPHRFRHPK